MDKQQLRQVYAERRNALTDAERQARSTAAAEVLAGLDEFKEKRRIAFYHAVGSEIDTGPAIARTVAAGKEVFLPVIDAFEQSMVFAPYHGPEKLEPGPLGILQPVRFLLPDEPVDLDIVIVPGLVFDRRGHRLGYGAGYYDRYLRESRALHAGFAYSFQVTADELPCEGHDHPVDVIVTDTEIIRTR